MLVCKLVWRFVSGRTLTHIRVANAPKHTIIAASARCTQSRKRDAQIAVRRALIRAARARRRLIGGRSNERRIDWTLRLVGSAAVAASRNGARLRILRLVSTYPSLNRNFGRVDAEEKKRIANCSCIFFGGNRKLCALFLLLNALAHLQS